MKARPIGCDEFGNGCGCKDCLAEHAEHARLNAEWRDALGDDLWRRLVSGLDAPLQEDKT